MNNFDILPTFDFEQEAIEESARIEEPRRLKRRRIETQVQTQTERITQTADDLEDRMNPEIGDALYYYRGTMPKQSYKEMLAYDEFGSDEAFEAYCKSIEDINVLEENEIGLSNQDISIRESRIDGVSERFLILHNEYNTDLKTVLNRQAVEKLISQLQDALPKLGQVGVDTSADEEDELGYVAQSTNLDQIRTLILDLPDHNK